MSRTRRSLTARVAFGVLCFATPVFACAADAAPSPLLAIDRNRVTVVERIVDQWSSALSQANAGITAQQLRDMLLGMRADQLLAASLVGNMEGLRNVVAAALVSESDVKPSLLQAKALGDADKDVVYVPVTPCRLVETRGTFAAVYLGGGPFAPNEVRTYTLTGGNGVCLTQLPASITPSAVQMQVYGIPTTAGSGDIEVLPQGATFGSSASLVYLGNNAFTSSAVTSLTNVGNKQIAVQVRGGGAHVAIDVVGYFRAPAGGYVSSIAAGGGLTGGGTGAVNLAVDTTVVQSRVTGTCAAGSSIRTINMNGTVACETDDVGAGTVTSLSQGAGITLSSNPITTTGSIAADTTFLQRRVSSSCLVGSSIRAIAADGSVTCQADNTGPANAFVQSGNAFGATGVLGLTDNNALDIRVNNARVMRFQPDAVSPNVVGGHVVNNVSAGVRGAFIGGGGVPAAVDPAFPGDGTNRVTDAYGTVAGGFQNRAGDDAGTVVDQAFATVGGGRGNVASFLGSVVAGGLFNLATGVESAVGGGGQNQASANVAVVAGGFQNVASGNGGVVSGGELNAASGADSTVAGGAQNVASASYGTVSGGFGNEASGVESAVAGGAFNTASGHYAFAMGIGSEARGDYSVAIGRGAKTFVGGNVGKGAIVFADSMPFDYGEFVDNRFSVRATGGVKFVTEVDGTGAALWQCLTNAGTGWSCSSDRSLKQDLVALDGVAVLEKLAAMPVYAWSPKGRYSRVRHYGPMAQDFMAAFGLGDDDRLIGMQDADGVALAAIQGLNAKLAEQAREIAALKQALQAVLARNGAGARSPR